jgi:hypothetical protein
MSSLKEAYSKPGAGILFWCGYGDNINEEVAELLNYIKEQGREAFYISTDGFDNTMLNLVKLIVEENQDLKEELRKIKTVEQPENFSPFNIELDRINKVLKSNLFNIEFPKEVFVFDAEIPQQPWKTIKDRTLDDCAISAVPYGKKIWVFGTAEYVQEKFSDLKQGELQRKPLTQINVHHNSVNFLLLSSLCKLFSKSFSVKTNFRNKLGIKENIIIFLTVSSFMLLP